MAQRRAYVQTAFAPGLIERRGLDALVEALARLREDAGALEVQGLRPAGADRVTVLIRTGREPVPMALTLILEPAAPRKIAGLEVTIGD